jgi:deazaflavin-dependent oxidoreductase (nitroreductase family)
VRDATARRLSTLHTALYRLTGGRVGRRLVDNDMLLLTTVGRATGAPHTVPLLYLRDGGRFIVFASWGGRDHHPEWYRNLLADPNATVVIPGRSMPVHAGTLGGEERTVWWERAVAAYDGYAAYQARTEREIPVVALAPVDRAPR